MVSPTMSLLISPFLVAPPQTTEIEVRIRETHDDPGVVGLHGIVRSVSGNLCSVFVRDEDKTVCPCPWQQRLNVDIVVLSGIW